jgi:hypothetical protein
MNSIELNIARVLFQNKVLKSHGQAFEDLFVSVMQAKDPGFRPVKPQGRKGDKKNDGFNKEKGQYYQVYSPEDPSNKQKQNLNKLKESFKGLYDYWQEISPIKEFYWVFNDHFKFGVYPNDEKELSIIENQYGIKAKPFLSKDLEDIFLSLQELDIIAILGGYLHDFKNIDDIDITVLGEVIDFLINSKIELIKTSFPDEINFYNKIKFNNLSNIYGTALKNAFHQDYIITEYFKFNSKFAKEDLKNVFSNFYQEALISIPESISEKSDNIFQFILSKASPRNEKVITDAVLLLMAHYFESCDIYEEPKERTLF